MKKLKQQIDRFLYNNSDKGIPNLMLFISVGTLIVYLFTIIDPSNVIYRFICFDRSAILHGQVWRLLTYVFVPTSSGIWLFLLLFAYYGIGRMVESVWGTLKFNLFYLCGVLIMDVAGLLLNRTASTGYLNLSLFLALATMYPDNKVLLMYIIPIKMKYLAWVYLLFTVIDVLQGDFFSVLALLNYFIFFGRDCRNVLPGADHVGSRRIQFRRTFSGKRSWGGKYQNSSGFHADEKKHFKKVVDAPAYRHKCTVCGRTDVSNPELDFRYCSRCNGFYCYCQDHINNHAHIQ